MTPWEAHKRRWSGCTLCPLHLTRKQVVLAGGSLPCDILLIGEAPGDSENVLGRPFVGPAGKLLDKIIAQALPDCRYRIAMTNLTACMPVKTESHQPTKESIDACHDRLVEFVNIAQPRLIVLVGDLAKKSIVGKAQFGECRWIPPGMYLEFASIPHPSRILQSSVAEQGLLYQRAVVTLGNAVESVFEQETKTN